MLDRREFLALGASGAIAWSFGARRRDDIYRVALLTGPADDDAAARPSLDGARLGFEEAAHTYRLLRREIELIETTTPPAHAHAIVALVPGDAGLAGLTDSALVVDALPTYDSLPCGTDPVFRIGVESAGTGARLWRETNFRYGAEQLNERFRRRFGYGMNDRAWAAWFAMKVVAEAGLRAPAHDAASLATWLLGPAARFDGHKGVALYFDPGRRLHQPLYDAPGWDETPTSDCAR